MREVKKRRGVGYTSQGGPLWDVNQYMKSKEESNEQIMQIFKMVRYFIKCEALTQSHDVAGIIIESAMLPLLETAFRSCSLLEMSKQSKLIETYLDMVETFAADKNLLACLLPVNDYFFEESLDPPQREPLHQLMEQHGETARIFLTALENEGSGRDQDPAPYLLAENL